MSAEKSTFQPARPDHRTTLRLETACEFSAVRVAIAQVYDWLAAKGFPEAELGAWQLALIEAANNAVKYADAAASALPVVIEISCGTQFIEARITDHTAGFEWPVAAGLPAKEAESGRGIYLIKSLTDSAQYFRSAGENILTLRRARPAGMEILTDAGEYQKRLAETEAALADMTGELALSYESLVALFRYSSELGTATDLKEFSQRLLRDLMQITEADGAVLRLLSADGKRLETFQTIPEKNLPPQNFSSSPATGSIEITAAQKRQDLWFSPAEPLAEKDPLRAIFPVGNGICHAFFVGEQLVGTATLGRLAAEKPFTSAQINLLHSFIDFLGIQIVNSRLLTERTTARVTRRELEIAAEIQRSLLPERLPPCAPFTLAAACQSALQVGGDFYDAMPAADGAVLLVIADVMGKGVPAALFAAVLRSTIRSMPQLFSQPDILLGAANRILFPDLSRVNMFITARLIYLDPARGEIISASAGHSPLLVCYGRAKGRCEPDESGFPLGIEPEVFYGRTVNVLPAGTVALLHTDGVTETRNASGEMLGEKCLQQLLDVAAEMPTVENGKQFLRERLTAFRGTSPLTDDQTFILIRNGGKK